MTTVVDTRRKKEAELELNEDQKKGVKLVVYATIAIFFQFLLVLFTGKPIQSLGNMTNSAIYSIGIYSPIMILSFLVLKKLKAKKKSPRETRIRAR